jgi:hypothetical protein
MCSGCVLSCEYWEIAICKRAEDSDYSNFANTENIKKTAKGFKRKSGEDWYYEP